MRISYVFENEIYLIFLTLWLALSLSLQMSDRGSGSGGPRRSDRLAKGKAVVYETESPPDTVDEYDAMEDVRTRFDASVTQIST